MKSYDQLATDLSKPGQQIYDEITPAKLHLWHMATGVAGEAGELLDAVKKHVVYNQPLDIENIVEELGDIQFYLAGIRSAINVMEETILHHNNRKLAKRYADGNYSNDAAKNRADKQHE